MSGPNEEATTVDASQTSAANALDVNAAARLKQLDAREQSLTAREHAIKDRERQVKDEAGALKEREAEVEAAKAKVQRDLADLAKRQKQVAETESSLEARARDVAQREIEASEGFATKNREALGALTKAHASLRAEVERLQAELDAARLKGLEDLEKRLADERRTRTEALDAEIAAERKRHLAKLAAEGAAQDAALGEQRARFAKEQQTALEEIERERVRLADLEAELRRGLGDLRWKEEDLAGVPRGYRAVHRGESA
jgi:chromosome segregation ATPase